MAQPLEIVLILKKPSINNSTQKRLQYEQLTKQHTFMQICAIRLKIVNWLNRAQLQLKTSRGTLFLAISMLDRLIHSHYPLDDETHEVVAGSLIMLASKFNEVYPPSPRKLNQLLTSDLYRSPEEFIQTQGSIFQALDFNLSENFNFYERLAQFEYFGPDSQKEKREKVIQTVICNVSLFRYGPEVLIRATERVIRGEAVTPQDSFSGLWQREITQIQSELVSEFNSTMKKGVSHSN